MYRLYRFISVSVVPSISAVSVVWVLALYSAVACVLLVFVLMSYRCEVCVCEVRGESVCVGVVCVMRVCCECVMCVLG